MPVIIHIRRKYAVFHCSAGHIYVDILIFLKKGSVPVFFETSEHCSVLHIVTVNEGIEVVKLLIVVVFGVDAPVHGAFSIHRMLKIVGIIIVASQYGIVNYGSGNIYPGIYIGILLFKLGKINRRLYIVFRNVGRCAFLLCIIRYRLYFLKRIGIRFSGKEITKTAYKTEYRGGKHDYPDFFMRFYRFKTLHPL